MAMALPLPLLPPVTSATFPASLMLASYRCLPWDPSWIYIGGCFFEKGWRSRGGLSRSNGRLSRLSNDFEGEPMSMKDKVAIVTGSSRGIGRGIAERLAAEGASVVVNGRHLDSIEPVVESIRAKGGQALPVVADVGVTADVDRLFSETVRAYGGLDVLVNNAAYSNPVAHFLEMDEDQWDRVIRSNLKSVYLCSHRAAKLMVEQGRNCLLYTSD